MAKALSIGLAAAQRRLAAQYGSVSWADLMRRVAALRDRGALIARSPLSAAAHAGDATAVKRLLSDGAPADGFEDEGATPLWHACVSEEKAAERIAIAEMLLAAGANVRRGSGGATPLHAAADRGPLALVETLIRNGAIEWQGDAKGRTALDAARRGVAPDKASIVELLDRPVIRDASFRAAVNAIHNGDEAALVGLIDAEPRLLSERIREPDCYRDSGRGQYFLDPKLFWFVADNPTLMRKMPANIVDIAQIMIDRGVAQEDLDYALELTITSASAREQGKQIPLLRALLATGARGAERAIEAALGHREMEAVEALLAAGYQLTLAIAAGTGRGGELDALLQKASPMMIQDALSFAVINGCNEAAGKLLEAGADPNAFMCIHKHSVPLHQAALDENVDLLALLIAHGARTDIRDLLWDGTPLDWARHADKQRSIAYLQDAARKVPPPGSD